MAFLANNVFLRISLCLATAALLSCSHARDYELVQADNFDGWVALIQTKRNWEYTRPFYYSISRDDQVFVEPTFIELDESDQVEVKLSNGLIYGVSRSVSDVVFFVYRIADGVYWPGSNKENKDILTNELRAKTGKYDLKPVSEVAGYYMELRD